ncbi:hypothetical protein BC936DRAFT_144798 [Jimgerdemannia flammicorona]|uniref:Uncharacterized protein n=2 Tax=Jimgerdemannia flammicorona TaxID=994334 RepID=A0A433DBM8_9FUNG|nr:hypothetical protein BC936DRAFT_144798 [Jimgerdemannia flammicorona]RUS26116.1 hypothetical protein BC938DRAFT_471209 [Jimgerdemannia flammicorona]
MVHSTPPADTEGVAPDPRNATSVQYIPDGIPLTPKFPPAAEETSTPASAHQVDAESLEAKLNQSSFRMLLPHTGSFSRFHGIWLAVLLIGIIVFSVGNSLLLKEGDVSWQIVYIEAENGREIVGNLAVKNGLALDAKVPGVVILHGVVASRTWMNYVTQTLAGNGMVALAIDYAGQGATFGTFEGGNATKALQVQDAYAAIQYLQSHPQVNSSLIAAVGWSLGGGVTYNINLQYPTLLTSNFLIGATVSFSKSNGAASPTFPANIAYGIGLNDELISYKDITTSMVPLTGVASDDLQVETLYGSFANGTARKICQRDTVDHIFEPMSSTIIACAVDWLHSGFRAKGAVPLDPPFVFSPPAAREIVSVLGGLSWLGFLFFAVVLFVRPAKTEHAEDEDEEETHSFPAWYLVHSLLFLIAFPLGYLLELSGGFRVMFLGLYIGFVVFGFLIFAAWYWRITRLSLVSALALPWRKARYGSTAQTLILFIVIVLILLQIVLYNVPWHYGYATPLFKSLQMAGQAWFWIRWVTFLGLWVVSTVTFVYEIEVIDTRVSRELTFANVARVILARVTFFVVALILEILPVVIAQARIFGPLQFVVLVLYPLSGMLFLTSVFTQWARSHGHQSLDIAIVIAGLITYTLVQSLPFTG